MADSDSSTDPDRKRKADRLELLGGLEGEIVVFQPMTIKEIGRGGMLIETALPFQLNSLHDVRLHLGDRSVIVKGRVVHCSVLDVNNESVHYRAGVEFIELPAHVADVIARFIEDLRKARQGE
jgi:hypothetical protein